MKLIFRLIKIAIIFLIIGVCFYLLINKTFIYENYKSEAMEGEGIPIKRFMYVIENNEKLETKFYTLLSENTLENMKKSYLDTLEYCYGKYYYDKNNEITITNYEIISKDYYKEVNINYVADNYCSENYKLSDMWVYDYISKSAYLNGNITEKNITDLIDKIYKSKKIEPVITDYKKEYSYKVYCENNDEKYTLIFEDFGENELLVKKEVENNVKFAIYEIENIKEYLKGLK